MRIKVNSNSEENERSPTSKGGNHSPSHHHNHVPFGVGHIPPPPDHQYGEGAGERDSSWMMPPPPGKFIYISLKNYFSISLYLCIVVFSVIVEWCVEEPLSTSVTYYSSTVSLIA